LVQMRGALYLSRLLRVLCLLNPNGIESRNV